MVNGSDRDDETIGDLGVRQTGCNESQHVHLSLGETGRVRTCGRGASAWDVAHTAVAQLLTHEASGGVGTERVEYLKRVTQGGVLAALGQGQRLLVGATEHLPCLRGLLPLTGDLQGPRMVSRLVHLAARLPDPVRRLESQPVG